MNEENRIDLWRNRIGKFAKIKYGDSRGTFLKLGIVVAVFDGDNPLVVLRNRKTTEEYDVALNHIIDSDVSELRDDSEWKQ